MIELIEGPLSLEGCEVADLSLSRYKSSVTLKVYVYASDGVTIDRCARLSRIIGDVIDGTDMFAGGYTLEVSSPGLSRPLTTARDFRYRTGETVAVTFVDPERKPLTAEIVSADEESVQLRNSEQTFSVPLSDIEKAKIVF